MRRYGLRDDQWERTKDFLTGREGRVRGTAKDSGLFVEAVLYRSKGGVPWRDLPGRFGDWMIVHQRFGGMTGLIPRPRRAMINRSAS
jgi:transposase